MNPTQPVFFDPAIWLALASLFTTVGLWVYTWLREGRMRRWALMDAERTAAQQKEAAEKLAEKLQESARVLAEKVNSDAIALASKANADAIELAAKVNREAAVMAKQVIADAEKLATKVHESAETLANKVAENTTVSTDAAKGAKEAFTEANSINKKIAGLQEQILRIGNHIEERAVSTAITEKAAHEEVLFNQRVKAAIDEKLEQMNGHAPRKKTKPRAARAGT